MTLTSQRNDKKQIPCVIVGGVKSYGFFPQMKAEGISWTEEKATTIVVGTNPGYQNGVVIVHSNGKEIL